MSSRDQILRRIPGWVLITIIAFDLIVLVVILAIVGISSGVIFGPAPIATPPSGPGTIVDLRAREEAILNSYGWVDQKAGIAHIPVPRAIDLVLARGLPSRPASAQSPTDEGLTLPSYSSSGTQPEQELH